MAWHRAFVHILKENYQAAVNAAQECIELSRTNYQVYGLSRGYNLKALAYLKSGDIDDARDCLEEGLHTCEMCAFASGVFRVYNNLGVIFCQVSDFKKGEEFFSLALDNVDQQLEYKQFPVLANLLMISMHTKNDSLLQKVQKRCDEIPSEDLLEYRKSLRPGMLEYRTTESFSFFGFSGLSYIF